MSIYDVLTLERIEKNIFRGQSQDIGTPQVFGGQVLAQALESAQATVEDRTVHSVHAYFLNKGDFDAPIIYEVDRSRSGRSFSARRVVAIQHGRPIFTMSASFQIDESGLDYGEKIEMPELPCPSTTAYTPWTKIVESDDGSASKSPKVRALKPTSYFDTEIISISNEHNDANLQAWLRLKENVSGDDTRHKTLLAYVSDLGLLLATLTPHGYQVFNPLEISKFALASVDHAMWFHRPFKIDDWLLYKCQAISTSNARGLAKGSFYTADGTLVATTMQEGLIRPLEKI